MRFLIPLLLVLFSGPAAADTRCGERDFPRLREAFSKTLRCQERVLRKRHRACGIERPECGRAPADELRELLAGDAAPGAMQRVGKAEARCQKKALRASTKYTRQRIRDRTRDRRRAKRAKRMIRRVERACEGITAGSELPSFGGACAELLVPGQPIPGNALAHCLRASVERIIDDTAPEPLRPNVVLVLTDDQRPETLDYMPEVDRLADQGMRFTDAFATTAICTPSRASIYSGQYAHNHGSRVNQQLFDDSDTLAPWLAEAGYTTGFFGKYRNDVIPGNHVPPGWDRWHGFAREEEGDAACGGPNSCFYEYLLNENGVLRQYGTRAEDYSTDLLATRLLDFVANQRTAPFFAVYAPYAPHLPPKPAPRHQGSYSDLPPWRPPNYDAGGTGPKPAWLAFAQSLFGPARASAVDQQRIHEIEALQSVDEAVGKLIEKLERLGLRDNTVIIFTSDHGIHWGEHGWTNKSSAYEEAIRIPLIVSHPTRNPTADESSQMVLNIDLAPTIAELADAGTGRVDGLSLLPLLQGPTPWRGQFLIENFVDFISRPNAAVRTARWKYIVTDAPAGVVEELYDLETDPYELENVVGYPENQLIRVLLERDLARLTGS